MMSKDIKNWRDSLSYAGLCQLDDFLQLLWHAIVYNYCLRCGCGSGRPMNEGLCLNCSRNVSGKDKEALEKVKKEIEFLITVRERQNSSSEYKVAQDYSPSSLPSDVVSKELGNVLLNRNEKLMEFYRAFRDIDDHIKSMDEGDDFRHQNFWFLLYTLFDNRDKLNTFSTPWPPTDEEVYKKVKTRNWLEPDNQGTSGNSL